MAVGVALQTITWRDIQGREATVRAWIRGAADANAQGVLAQDWITKSDALTSQAAVNAAHGPINSAPQPPNYGVTGIFQSVLDKARFVFFDTVGGVHRYQVPAPNAAIFRPDSVTVDPAFGIVSAFIIAAQTDLCDRSGNHLTVFAGGVRIERKLPRRPGILVRDSGLTPGEPAE